MSFFLSSWSWVCFTTHKRVLPALFHRNRFDPFLVAFFDGLFVVCDFTTLAERLSLIWIVGLNVVSRCNQAMAPGTSVSFSIRPEDIQVFPRDRDWSGDNKFDGKIVEKLFLGEATELEVAVGEHDPITSRIQSRIDQEFNFKEDDLVLIGWNAEDCNLLSN